MNSLGLGGYALSGGVAVVLLGGCGGSPPPISAPGTTMPQTSAIAGHVDRGTSWMAPQAKNDDLTYVGDERAVTVYSYPKGVLVGDLKGFYRTGRLCVDKRGDVFIVDFGKNAIYEYAHGGKSPIETIPGPGYPFSCAVDPRSRKLAVTSLAGISSTGKVLIYPHGSGNPTVYTDSNIASFFFCAYDDLGNLYVDGQQTASGTGTFEFAELAKGGSGLTNIALGVGWTYPGGVQWDGKYVVVSNQIDPYLYRYAISGSSAVLEGVVDLKNSPRGIYQFWIKRPRVLVRNPLMVQFWNYPAGGTPTETITRRVNRAFGVTLSVAK